VLESGERLEHLKGLGNLRFLFLVQTKVTAEGVKELKGALPNCRILIPRTDAGKR